MNPDTIFGTLSKCQREALLLFEHTFYCEVSMNQDPVITLARRTPIDVLCVAWGCSDKEVGPRLDGREPMTVREAGDLAAIHGLKLEDILRV